MRNVRSSRFSTKSRAIIRAVVTAAGAAPDTESVEQVVFAFYENRLFRMTIDYDQARTEGPIAALARTAAARALVLDAREAPQREAAREKKEAEDRRAAEEKARVTNKATFRP